MTLPCIICHRVLDPVFSDVASNQPCGAVTFRAGGQYGSTAYDPFGADRYLELNVCDPCLIAAGDAARVKEVLVAPHRPTMTYMPWPRAKENA